jgi:AcrR family transcriptional regulator
VTATRAERRRQEIMETALELFAERGYHHTGVADIAAKLRMSHGTFYRYFESKRDILDHVISEITRRVGIAVTAENSPGTAPTLEAYKRQARQIAASLLDVVHQDPRIAQVLLLEATGIDKEVTAQILDLLEAMREVTAQYLRHGVEAGFLRADLDVIETARAVNGIIYAGALHAIRADDADAPEQFVEAALAVIFDGIAAAVAE